VRMYKIVTHSVLGEVCDLLRARVTAEKNSVVFESASVRAFENHTLLLIWSVSRFSTQISVRKSPHRRKLGGLRKCVYEGRTFEKREKNSEVLKSASVRV